MIFINNSCLLQNAREVRGIHNGVCEKQTHHHHLLLGVEDRLGSECQLEVNPGAHGGQEGSESMIVKINLHILTLHLPDSPVSKDMFVSVKKI